MGWKGARYVGKMDLRGLEEACSLSLPSLSALRRLLKQGIR